MASVYKRKRTRTIPAGAEVKAARGGHVATWRDSGGRIHRAPLDESGQRIVVEDGGYTIGFNDHNGDRKTFPGTTDKVATDRLADRIEALVACRIARAEPTGDLRDWLDSRPAKFLRRLAELDLIDGGRFAVGKSLADHVCDYERYLTDIKGRAASHVDATIQRVERVIAAAGARHWHDLTGKIEKGLADAQLAHKLTDQSRNAYLTAIKAFCNWMIRQGKALSSPAAGIEPVQIDTGEHRRALEPDEATRVIAAAEATDAATFIKRTREGDVRCSIDGAERAILYRFAIETGLRSSTIRRLTVGDFDLSEGEPIITVQGERATKEKRTRRIPLTAATAKLLAARFNAKLRTAPAFVMPRKD